MSIPKSKILSVSKGLMALADFKTGSPDINNSQSVIVNVTPNGVDQSIKQKSRSSEAIHPIIDGKEDPDITIVPHKETQVNVSYDDTTVEENPYNSFNTKSRDLSSVEDIRNDFQQLQSLITQKENLAKALAIILNLVENNPLIINKLIVAPSDILSELIKLLTSAEEVKISYLFEEEAGCVCSVVKFLPVDKIYVVKNGETKILKYDFPDAIQVLDEHKISYKMVCNNI